MEKTLTTPLAKTSRRSHVGNAMPEFRRRTRRKMEGTEAQKVNEEGEEEVVEEKIAALQRIVPGGELLGVDELFEETAGYILALQCQIKAMKVLAGFLEGLDKEKMKLGG